MAEHMLTTNDNPYNPVTHFDEWLVFDTTKGYNTLPYLGRVVITSDELSEADQSVAIEQAIDDIIAEDELGIYRKVEIT